MNDLLPPQPGEQWLAYIYQPEIAERVMSKLNYMRECALRKEAHVDFPALYLLSQFDAADFKEPILVDFAHSVQYVLREISRESVVAVPNKHGLIASALTAESRLIGQDAPDYQKRRAASNTVAQTLSDTEVLALIAADIELLKSARHLAASHIHDLTWPEEVDSFAEAEPARELSMAA